MRKSSEFEKLTNRLRLKILQIANQSKSPHVGSCLSCIDAIAYLYNHILRFVPSEPDWPNRDYFILSKGHAALALYVTLAENGVIPESTLTGYMQDNGTLPAHLDRFSAPGIEVSAGSLGHGLSIGLGIAHGLKLKGKKNRVYVLMGDGESQEGAVWEAAMQAPVLGLDNLVAYIDHNNLQGYGRPCELMQYEPVTDKWRAFGWHATQTDGHDFKSIAKATNAALGAEQPAVVVLKTIKGKGVSFMENQLKWHYYIVTDDHLETARQELNNA
jgi:transketolase